MSGAQPIEAAICDAARDLPDWAIDAFVGALRAFGDQSHARRNAVLDCVSLPHHRGRVRDVLTVWAANAPELPAIAVETALLSAARAFRSATSAQATSLVWTGPQAVGVYLRGIEQALVDVINAARHELLLVTFAAYRIPLVLRSLEQAIHRGVSISFVGESALESGGRVSFDPSIALGESLLCQVEVFVWPQSKRREIDGRAGTLHAKCAIADQDLLLVSSANLTDLALALNMEIGVLIHGGEIPKQAHAHFHALIADRTLVPWR